MNSVKISPSLLAADMSCLREEIDRAVEGGCDDIHIDIMDGHFVPNLTFGPDIIATLRELTNLPLDVHLMIDNPLDMLAPFAEAGSDYLTIHVEIENNTEKIIEKIQELGVKPGISLKPDTSPQAVFPYLKMVDIVLVMSVYPGFGGQEFIEESYNRIREISVESKNLSTELLISVDGGVTFENAPKLVRAGANHIVAGTTIFKGHNAKENIRLMREAIESAGNCRRAGPSNRYLRLRPATTSG